MELRVPVVVPPHRTETEFVPFQSQTSDPAFCSKEVLSLSQPRSPPLHTHSPQDKHLWSEKSHVQARCFPSCPNGHCSQENTQGLGGQAPGFSLRFITFIGVYYFNFSNRAAMWSPSWNKIKNREKNLLWICGFFLQEMCERQFRNQPEHQRCWCSAVAL